MTAGNLPPGGDAAKCLFACMPSPPPFHTHLRCTSRPACPPAILMIAFCILSVSNVSLPMQQLPAMSLSDSLQVTPPPPPFSHPLTRCSQANTEGFVKARRVTHVFIFIFIFIFYSYSHCHVNVDFFRSLLRLPLQFCFVFGRRAVWNVGLGLGFVVCGLVCGV